MRALGEVDLERLRPDRGASTTSAPSPRSRAASALAPAPGPGDGDGAPVQRPQLEPGDLSPSAATGPTSVIAGARTPAARASATSRGSPSTVR